MTEEQLKAAGWSTQEDATLPRGWRWSKRIGAAYACKYWNNARERWEAWAVRQHPTEPMIEARSKPEMFETGEEAVAHAERMAAVIEAWLPSGAPGAATNTDAAPEAAKGER